MRQSLHLLIVDRGRGEALVTWHGARWLLPILSVPERVRAGPLVLQWAAERRIPGQVIGQWLGRMAQTSDAVDWLTVFLASSQDKRAATSVLSNLHWVPLASLKLSTSWLAYQQWALARALSTAALPQVPGPFGTTTWIDEIQTWLDEVLHPRRARTSETIVPYRITAYEVVLQLRRADRFLYFKGFSPDKAAEAMIASNLSEIAPDSFPRTVALERKPDGTCWWLIEPCAGSVLARDLTCERAVRVIAEYARVQRRVTNYLRHGHQPLPLPTLELSPMASWGTELLRETGEREECAWRRDAIQVACERVREADVPHSCVSADLDPANVIVDSDDVRFIDLDDCVLGPAPIAAATFARRTKRLGLSCGNGLYRSYVEAWEPPIEMHDRWCDFDVVSILVECYLSWKRVVIKTGRGEIVDLLEPARGKLVQRLTEAVSGASGKSRSI